MLGGCRGCSGCGTGRHHDMCGSCAAGAATAEQLVHLAWHVYTCWLSCLRPLPGLKAGLLPGLQQSAAVKAKLSKQGSDVDSNMAKHANLLAGVVHEFIAQLGQCPSWIAVLHVSAVILAASAHQPAFFPPS